MQDGMLHGALHRFIVLALLHLNSETNLGLSLGWTLEKVHIYVPFVS